MSFIAARNLSNYRSQEIILTTETAGNPPRRAMALVLTQRLTEMSTKNRSVGKARKARKADNLTAVCEPPV
jgi:hypothetical protein